MIHGLSGKNGNKYISAYVVVDFKWLLTKGMRMMADNKKEREKPKYTLTSMQEVRYQRDFKLADRAGGYDDRRSKH